MNGAISTNKYQLINKLASQSPLSQIFYTWFEISREERTLNDLHIGTKSHQPFFEVNAYYITMRYCHGVDCRMKVCQSKYPHPTLFAY